MKIFICLIIGVLLAACTQIPARTTQSQAAEVKAVIESFNRAIVARDREAYLNLFVQGNVGWQSVMDDFQLARERRKRPNATRAGVDPNNTHIAFIDNAVKNPKVGGVKNPPVFPITVETDGDVASASQDYRFFYEGREVGRGRSMWLLVKTEQGWKISSVVYSKRQPGPGRKAGA